MIVQMMPAAPTEAPIATRIIIVFRAILVELEGLESAVGVGVSEGGAENTTVVTGLVWLILEDISGVTVVGIVEEEEVEVVVEVEVAEVDVLDAPLRAPTILFKPFNKPPSVLWVLLGGLADNAGRLVVTAEGGELIVSVLTVVCVPVGFAVPAGRLGLALSELGSEATLAAP